MEVAEETKKSSDSMESQHSKPVQHSVFVQAPVHQNEVILNNIFGILGTENSIDDLKSCRLVCSNWNRLVRRSIQDLYWTNRIYPKIPVMFQIQKYLRTMTSSENSDMLFSCYNLGPFNQRTFGLLPGIDRGLLTEFFATFSQGMKSLCLDIPWDSQKELLQTLSSQCNSLTELKISTNARGWSLPSWGNLSHPQSQWDFQLPNLKYLCWSNQPHSQESESSYIGFQLNFLEMILTKLPEKTEKCIKIFLKLHSWISGIIDVLQKYAKLKHLKYLSVENIRYSVVPSILTSLVDNDIHLQSLILSPISNDEDDDFQEDFAATRSVYEFLVTQSNDLEMLSWISGFYFKFPLQPMAKLKKLKLVCNQRYDHIDWLNYGHRGGWVLVVVNGWNENNAPAELIAWINSRRPIFYQTNFPVLQELELDGSDSYFCDFQSWYLQHQLPCNSLLKLGISCPRIDEEIIKEVGNIFPRITSLRIRATDFMGEREGYFYSALWNAEFAPTIQNLSMDICCWFTYSIKKPFEMDSYFSGVSAATIREAIEMSDFERSSPPSTSNSIFNFKCLKKLFIFGPKINSVFTDFSAFCVFGQMKNLEVLHLSNEIQKFSESALLHLKKKYEQRSPYVKHVKDVSEEEQVDRAFKTDFNSVKENHKHRVRNLLDGRMVYVGD